MTNEGQKETKEDETLDVRVDRLARELARTINAGVMEQRVQLRETAIHLLRDEVEVVVGQAAPSSLPSHDFNAFGIAIPLFLVGAVMIILFPPVGLLLFAAAVVMMAWGLGAVVLHR